MVNAEIGVIGGSGLYEMGLSDIVPEKVSTPFGDPSDEFVTGTINGVRVAFLARHGKGHRIQPSEINYRANIYAMKKLGVKKIISVSAVGSMKENIIPGEMVIPDQFYDNTRHRISTFFGNGIVGHVPFADPVCGTLADDLYKATKEAKIPVHKGGTYICIEGPQFSSRAESLVYRSWGVSIIGMTNVTEAKLAREAGICYATLAMATDFDCWHQSEESVTVEAIIAILKKNVEGAKRIISIAAPNTSECGCNCKNALKDGIMTPKNVIPEKTAKDLDIIIKNFI